MICNICNNVIKNNNEYVCTNCNNVIDNISDNFEKLFLSTNTINAKSDIDDEEEEIQKKQIEKAQKEEEESFEFYTKIINNDEKTLGHLKTKIKSDFSILNYSSKSRSTQISKVSFNKLNIGKSQTIIIPFNYQKLIAELLKSILKMKSGILNIDVGGGKTFILLLIAQYYKFIQIPIPVTINNVKNVVFKNKIILYVTAKNLVGNVETETSGFNYFDNEDIKKETSRYFEVSDSPIKFDSNNIMSYKVFENLLSGRGYRGKSILDGGGIHKGEDILEYADKTRPKLKHHPNGYRKISGGKFVNSNLVHKSNDNVNYYDMIFKFKKNKKHSEFKMEILIKNIMDRIQTMTKKGNKKQTHAQITVKSITEIKKGKMYKVIIEVDDKPLKGIKRWTPKLLKSILDGPDKEFLYLYKRLTKSSTDKLKKQNEQTNQLMEYFLNEKLSGFELSFEINEDFKEGLPKGYKLVTKKLKTKETKHWVTLKNDEQGTEAVNHEFNRLIIFLDESDLVTGKSNENRIKKNQKLDYNLLQTVCQDHPKLVIIFSSGTNKFLDTMKLFGCIFPTEQSLEKQKFLANEIATENIKKGEFTLSPKKPFYDITGFEIPILDKDSDLSEIVRTITPLQSNTNIGEFDKINYEKLKKASKGLIFHVDTKKNNDIFLDVKIKEPIIIDMTLDHTIRVYNNIMNNPRVTASAIEKIIYFNSIEEKDRKNLLIGNLEFHVDNIDKLILTEKIEDSVHQTSIKSLQWLKNVYKEQRIKKTMDKLTKSTMISSASSDDHNIKLVASSMIAAGYHYVSIKKKTTELQKLERKIFSINLIEASGLMAEKIELKKRIRLERKNGTLNEDDREIEINFNSEIPFNENAKQNYGPEQIMIDNKKHKFAILSTNVLNIKDDNLVMPNEEKDLKKNFNTEYSKRGFRTSWVLKSSKELKDILLDVALKNTDVVVDLTTTEVTNTDVTNVEVTTTTKIEDDINTRRTKINLLAKIAAGLQINYWPGKNAFQDDDMVDTLNLIIEKTAIEFGNDYKRIFDQEDSVTFLAKRSGPVIINFKELFNTTQNKNDFDLVNILNKVAIYGSKLTPEQKEDATYLLLNAWNDKNDNLHGEKIMTMLVSSEFTQGINLFGVTDTLEIDVAPDVDSEKQRRGRSNRAFGSQGLIDRKINYTTIVSKFSESADSTTIGKLLSVKVEIDEEEEEEFETVNENTLELDKLLKDDVITEEEYDKRLKMIDDIIALDFRRLPGTDHIIRSPILDIQNYSKEPFSTDDETIYAHEPIRFLANDLKIEGINLLFRDFSSETSTISEYTDLSPDTREKKIFFFTNYIMLEDGIQKHIEYLQLNKSQQQLKFVKKNYAIKIYKENLTYSSLFKIYKSLKTYITKDEIFQNLSTSDTKLRDELLFSIGQYIDANEESEDVKVTMLLDEDHKLNIVATYWNFARNIPMESTLIDYLEKLKKIAKDNIYIYRRQYKTKNKRYLYLANWDSKKVNEINIDLKNKISSSIINIGNKGILKYLSDNGLCKLLLDKNIGILGEGMPKFPYQYILDKKAEKKKKESKITEEEEKITEKTKKTKKIKKKKKKVSKTTKKQKKQKRKEKEKEQQQQQEKEEKQKEEEQQQQKEKEEEEKRKEEEQQLQQQQKEEEKRKEEEQQQQQQQQQKKEEEEKRKEEEQKEKEEQTLPKRKLNQTEEQRKEEKEEKKQKLKQTEEAVIDLTKDDSDSTENDSDSTEDDIVPTKNDDDSTEDDIIIDLTNNFSKFIINSENEYLIGVDNNDDQPLQEIPKFLGDGILVKMNRVFAKSFIKFDEEEKSIEIEKLIKFFKFTKNSMQDFYKTKRSISTKTFKRYIKGNVQDSINKLVDYYNIKRDRETLFELVLKNNLTLGYNYGLFNWNYFINLISFIIENNESIKNRGNLIEYEKDLQRIFNHTLFLYQLSATENSTDFITMMKKQLAINFENYYSEKFGNNLIDLIVSWNESPNFFRMSVNKNLGKKIYTKPTDITKTSLFSVFKIFDIYGYPITDKLFELIKNTYKSGLKTTELIEKFSIDDLFKKLTLLRLLPTTSDDKNFPNLNKEEIKQQIMINKKFNVFLRAIQQYKKNQTLNIYDYLIDKFVDLRIIMNKVKALSYDNDPNNKPDNKLSVGLLYVVRRFIFENQEKKEKETVKNIYANLYHFLHDKNNLDISNTYTIVFRNFDDEHMESDIQKVNNIIRKLDYEKNDKKFIRSIESKYKFNHYKSTGFILVGSKNNDELFYDNTTNSLNKVYTKKKNNEYAIVEKNSLISLFKSNIIYFKLEPTKELIKNYLIANTLKSYLTNLLSINMENVSGDDSTKTAILYTIFGNKTFKTLKIMINMVNHPEDERKYSNMYYLSFKLKNYGINDSKKLNVLFDKINYFINIIGFQNFIGKFLLTILENILQDFDDKNYPTLKKSIAVFIKHILSINYYDIPSLYTYKLSKEEYLIVKNYGTFQKIFFEKFFNKDKDLYYEFITETLINESSEILHNKYINNIKLFHMDILTLKNLREHNKLQNLE